MLNNTTKDLEKSFLLLTFAVDLETKGKEIMTTYIIYANIELSKFESRHYFCDTYPSCTDSDAWTCNEYEAYEFDTKEEAEEYAEEIKEAFLNLEWSQEIYTSVLEKETFDVVFNDGEKSNRKGWHATYKECIDYIETYNGTDESYFADYKGGVVSIVCTQTNDIAAEFDVE